MTTSSVVKKTLISLAGLVISTLVTIQLKKMLEAKGLPERKEELKEALRKAGLTAGELKETVATWVSEKATTAAAVASSVAKSADDVATQEKVNG